MEASPHKIEPMTMARQLEQLAEACGVLTSYQDVYQQRRQVSVESLLAVLQTLRVPVTSLSDVPQALAAKQTERLQRGIEPVVVVWDGEPAAFELTLPADHTDRVVDCVVHLEGREEQVGRHHRLDRLRPRMSSCGCFKTYELAVPAGLKQGYHALVVETSERTFRASILSAPRHAYKNDAGRRKWGCFLPLYSLHSSRNWGAGDFTDLQNLADWTARAGGDVTGTLPLLAAFLDEPGADPSPYSPVSRLAWNEFYVDVQRAAEWVAVPAAAERVQSADFRASLAQVRASKGVPYYQIMALKRRVLELLCQWFFRQQPPQRMAQFQQFLRDRPHVEDYAEFRAAGERQSAAWQQWPAAMRDGNLSERDYEAKNKQYHLYVQWIAHQQLAAMETSGSGLYLDLPLGVRHDGYDVWRWRDCYARGASAGSPPDAVWTQGQDWSFPPLHPEAIREQGYLHVRDYVRHHLQHTSRLRIDHVMQLHRLFWIPRGLPAKQGVYVRYRPEEFYAVFALESHRHRAELVGENLGTVPQEVNDAMDRHHFRRMYVVQYEMADEQSPGETASAGAAPSGPGVETAVDALPVEARQNETQPLKDVPAGAVASLNTHDMPPFAAWWHGEDLPLREELGLLDKQESARERQQLERNKKRLTAWLCREGLIRSLRADEREVMLGLLKFLAASDAGVALVNLEDLWLERRPQNIPGTGPERDNWTRRSALSWEAFTRNPDVVGALREIEQLRARVGTSA